MVGGAREAGAGVACVRPPSSGNTTGEATGTGRGGTWDKTGEHRFCPETSLTQTRGHSGQDKPRRMRQHLRQASSDLRTPKTEEQMWASGTRWDRWRVPGTGQERDGHIWDRREQGWGAVPSSDRNGWGCPGRVLAGVDVGCLE